MKAKIRRTPQLCQNKARQHRGPPERSIFHSYIQQVHKRPRGWGSSLQIRQKLTAVAEVSAAVDLSVTTEPFQCWRGAGLTAGFQQQTDAPAGSQTQVNLSRCSKDGLAALLDGLGRSTRMHIGRQLRAVKAMVGPYAAELWLLTSPWTVHTPCLPL